MDYIYILREALVWMVTIFWLYQIAISLCSLVKLKEKPLKIKKDHRFMAIIPAHNEETVIGNLIESLKNQNYNKELYDIYVIADNCTDNTARVARGLGAIVYERYDENKKTKGAALDWFLQQKIKEDAPYDAICVFDADNIVDKNFIKAMNKKLCQGEDVVQGYRDIKNPTDNWITSGYALFYWTNHRFYHLARYNLGLSTMLNGTGFMVNFNIIKENNGWKTVTLTEDIEFSLQRILKGRKLGWATDAILYDEQPSGFIMYLDGKPIKPMIKGFFTYPLFMGSWIIINIKCLFKRETTWEKITHNRSIKIDDVEQKEIAEIEKI